MKPINNKTQFYYFFSSLLIIAFLSFAFINNVDKEAKDITVTGEVLDLSCFIKSGAKGPEHKSCATACINKGNPIGLLTKDGKAYLIVEDHDNAKPYADLKDMAAETVTISGMLQERNGLPGIVLAKVEAGKK
ncbi:MAG: hypothetical protein M3421_03595 [Bacteroidota bacterium]|jgi:hypothetical protein|nr:hypothetical protein [Bacteroidota bacterium]